MSGPIPVDTLQLPAYCMARGVSVKPVEFVKLPLVPVIVTAEGGGGEEPAP